MSFLSYIQGKRKGRKAHELEKKSMSDPFLSDAIDGYDKVSGDHIETLRALSSKITEQTKPTKKSKTVSRMINVAILALALLSGAVLLWYTQQATEPKLLADMRSLDSDSIEMIALSKDPVLEKIADEESHSIAFTPPIITEDTAESQHEALAISNKTEKKSLSSRKEEELETKGQISIVQQAITMVPTKAADADFKPDSSQIVLRAIQHKPLKSTDSLSSDIQSSSATLQSARAIIAPIQDSLWVVKLTTPVAINPRDGWKNIEESLKTLWSKHYTTTPTEAVKDTLTLKVTINARGAVELITMLHNSQPAITHEVLQIFKSTPVWQPTDKKEVLIQIEISKANK